jgi:hypothetical protein
MTSASIESERHVELAAAWFHHCGCCEGDKPYVWSGKHWVHIGGDNTNRWHLIIDMEMHELHEHDLRKVPYEVFRVNCDERGEL